MNKALLVLPLITLLSGCLDENPLEANKGKASEWLNNAPMTLNELKQDEIDKCLSIILNDKTSTDCEDFFKRAASAMNRKGVLMQSDIKQEHFHSKVFWEQMIPLREERQAKIKAATARNAKSKALWGGNGK